ncbi:potassium channel family protein [Halalkalibacillus halophilus]|uniref:potassium channel family protein n=1 Tax=Halalkalibacillus halophilus TaxID=392827 RepID=UPI0003F925BA|nr:potassium channel family protein [Halalkalibacillus halophilus]
MYKQSISLAIVLLILIISMVMLFRGKDAVRGYFSKELFTMFVAIYFIFMIGFGLMYFLLAEMNVTILVDESLKVGSTSERFFQAIYFSGVTLMTIGYGDITPIGIGRVLAMIEAFIGFLFPAAFLYKLFQS